VPESVLAKIFGVGAGKGSPITFISRLLLGWYLREIRRMEIPEDPGEAIVTYPLA
jgi:hypothetical protein